MKKINLIEVPGLLKSDRSQMGGDRFINLQNLTDKTVFIQSSSFSCYPSEGKSAQKNMIALYKEV